MASDRILGLVVILGAFAYFAGALQIQTSFLSDPLGPRTFPIVIAVAGLICGIAMVMRPDAEPEWPEKRAWIGMGAALVVLVAYAYTIVPLGFLVPTAIASALIGYLIDPKPTQSAIMGATLAVVLFIIFKYGLGLGLFALPRWLIG
ncbi:tripartite tricarboxylate transporter TctB family protein [Thioclava sp. FR2]|uniref:tripartite tricarboxylate transporter TctB family protein n=1 Tax=Thioclava sp. FR2 TaxID=3445780 RepID=UPI003EB922DD